MGCIFQVLDALVSLFCRSNISAETLWDGGWLLRQLFPYSESEFNNNHLKLLKVRTYEILVVKPTQILIHAPISAYCLHGGSRVIYLSIEAIFRQEWLVVHVSICLMFCSSSRYIACKYSCFMILIDRDLSVVWCLSPTSSSWMTLFSSPPGQPSIRGLSVNFRRLMYIIWENCSLYLHT